MERRPRLHLLSARRRTRALALSAGLGALCASVSAKVFLTQEEALRLAFPEASVERKTAFLTASEQGAVRTLARSETAVGALVPYYVASRDGSLVGTAYFDTHIVRTQPETIMVVVDAAGSVARVEVLSFLEPEDYLPRGRWYAQFVGRPLGDGLGLDRDIRPVAGATLTARATTAAVRRVLALHAILARRRR